MTGRLIWWFGAVVWLAFTATMVLWPVLGPAGPRMAVRPAQTTAAGPAGPHPPDPTPDPFDPAWTPSDGRWHDPTTYHDVAARHACMIGVPA